MHVMRLLFLGLVVLLPACDSGGNGKSVETGQLIDSAVSGVRYETATRSGVTDSEGQFKYLSGETVRFYIGEQYLGEATGAATVTLFDLVEGVTPVVGTALEDAIWNWKSGPGFHTVINMATLLQTLDSDGNPDNGIQITQQVAALFTADSVDFNQHWQEFRRDSGFRHAIAEAKANALLDQNRQIRAPWRAMDHLYTSIGIDSELHVAASGEANESGFWDARKHAFQYGFDAEGKVTQEEYTDDPDGLSAVTYSNAYAYDADGNPVRSEQNISDSDSSRISTYAYNSTGDLVRIERNPDSNGARHTVTTYTYDTNGNQTRVEIDRLDDGIIDEIYTYSYDAHGNLVLEEHDSDGNDVTPNDVATYTYDANDNLLRIEEEWNGDSTPEVIYSYSYDDHGNLLREENDYDGDGSPDQIQTFAYDDNGNRVREEYDYSGDGIPDQIKTFTYDNNGSLIREEYDYSGDGSPDQIQTYAYDNNGNLIQEDSDYDGNGAPDIVSILTYDSNGNPERGVGHFDDNSPDQILAFTYDADNNLASSVSYYEDETSTPAYSYNFAWDSQVPGWWTVFNPGHNDLTLEEG